MKVKIKHWNRNTFWDLYGNMIMKMAHSLSKKYGRDFDELLSEGAWGAWSLLKDWNPKRAGKTTWVYRTAYHRMVNLCIKKRREIPVDMQASDDDEQAKPILNAEARSCFIESFLSELSEEARVFVRTLVEAPEELRDVVKHSRPVSSMRALEAYMIDMLDWTRKDVERVCSEVQACL